MQSYICGFGHDYFYLWVCAGYTGLCSAGSNGSSDWLLPSSGKIKVRKSIGLFTDANLDCCSWIHTRGVLGDF